MADKDTKDSEKKTVAPVEKKSVPLSSADLDKVSGGINPQPLPPIVRVKQ